MPATEEQKIARAQALRQIVIDQLSMIKDCANEACNDSNKLSRFKIAFKNMKKLVKDFEKHHNALVVLHSQNPDKLQEENQILHTFTSNYLDIETTYNDLFDQDPKPLSGGVLNQTLAAINEISCLPKIDLIHFTGSVEKFPTFIEMFEALVHNSRTLSNIEKFNYLLSIVSGPPLALLKTIPLVADNYTIAYNTLKERYDNKRLQAVSHWKAIENYPSVNKDNVYALRNLIDTFSENLSALNAMGYNTDQWDFILTNMLLDRLDAGTRKAFEQKHASNEMPKYNTLKEFIKRQCTALESVALSIPKKSVSDPKYDRPADQRQGQRPWLNKPPVQRHKNAFFIQQSDGQQQKQMCFLCNDKHIIYNCPTFLSKSEPERFDIIKFHKACVNCLANLHTTTQCTSVKRCKFCNQKHHSLLHFNKNNAIVNHTDNELQKDNIATQTNFSNQSASTSGKFSQISGLKNDPKTVKVGMLLNDHEILLSTIVLNIKDKFGNWHKARAVLDTGAQSSFICKKLADKLGLQKYNIALTLQGLERMCMPAKSGIHCIFTPIEQPSVTFEVNFIIIDKICDDMPSSSFSLDNLTYLNNLKLADPHFNIQSEIEILLGADVFPNIITDGRISPNTANQPTCLNTIFGWTVMGKLSFSETPLVSQKINSFFTTFKSNEMLDNTLKTFWQLEEVPDVKAQSPEDLFCEKYFLETTKQSADNKFIVSLPFKISAPDFGDTRFLAMRRFLSLEKRLLQDNAMHVAYSDVLKEYLENGHMEQVLPPSNADINNYFYIAHHAVFRKDSLSTPLRVVFDASSHAHNKLSLNQCLYTGPKLQRDLVSILLTFRLFRYVITCDIKQMFRMIWIDTKQRNYQRILWRFSQDSPVLDFQLNTVSFGVVCSPYLAIRVLLMLASKYTDLPLASEIINNQTYVDDICFGNDNFEKITLMKCQLIQLLGRAGLELRKWASNEPLLLNDLPESHIQNTDLSLDLENNTNTLKILGLKWSPSSDSFYYSFNTVKGNYTKRTMLSELAKTFDVLGFLTPLTFFMKRLIQLLWFLGLGWDETPPNDVVEKWSRFKNELFHFSDILIPRHIDLRNNKSIQLIGFCDASTYGYCAVCYLRVIYNDDSIKTFFLYAKSKVAPLKTVSVPRLELCGAVLLSKVVQFILTSYRNVINIDNIFAFTDSTIVLSWIKSSAHAYKTFVSNRIAFIQEKLSPNYWYHVPTKLNAADCGSRGLFPSELSFHKLWWNGPEFLLKPVHTWLSQPTELSIPTEVENENRKIILTTKVNKSFLDELLQKFSSLTKIKRIIAYVLRFVHMLKSKKVSTTNFNLFSDYELNNALLLLVKHIQHVHFAEEIVLIQNKSPLPRLLRKLSPFLDNSNLLRVGGRLCHADLTYEQKFPLLLPSNSVLTTLIITEIHNLHMHAGIQTTYFLLTQNYWILSCKKLIRKIVSRCKNCWRTQPKSFQPPMGNLPKFRVSEAKAFLNVGVDLAGPLLIKMGNLRNAKTTKAYICLFVCCATKALHLELLSDMSTECFLAALRRLIARRGKCLNVYSDCGSNLVGANNYLKNIFEDVAKSEAIQWHFNPPGAPHMGGLWESNIKVVKTHLFRVIGNQVLTYEELNTVLIQIEAVLNSRPLTPLSADPSDLGALTPGHFLTLGPLTAIPDPDTLKIELNRHSRWQLLQRLHNDFWRRWRNEYLHTLTQKAKWHLPGSTNATIGTMVLIKNENTPPLEWCLGRIVELIHGSDNIARVAIVKTTKGLFKRPLVKLCPLPV